ncbi:MAG: methionyl-tRNA synthetase [Chloroflexi bacterium]|jgi:methionyl-tRNA synthetase|nr:MAG: methionyl-tRNA synthetase [Chloroflexota bacterium]
MTERIFVAVAWPYANGPLHLGHIAGCYLPADIFARYHRLIGNDVLMVSGSDSHGTPITLRSEQEGISPKELVARFHDSFMESWEGLGIQWDLFTSTATDNHREVVHDIWRTLDEKGLIYTAVMPLPYCHVDKRFLPDRYVEGTCPHCSFDKARGDQCDNCGHTLEPQELKDLRCRLCGATPEIRESEHFFFSLSSFREALLEWVGPQTTWRPNVRNFTVSFLEGELKDRPISRDISWGVPLPMDGQDSKRVYVWFEAVVGYLSASKEWAKLRGTPDAWEDFWKDPSCRPYYFIGKDNIPFHTIIWPAMLMGYGGLNLPFDVPANEFLTIEGSQLSTSRNWAVWVPDYLERFDPDPLRYYLSAHMPETSDSSFSWKEFQRRNNDELVATFGNLVHRVLSFTYRNFDGQVPEPGDLDQRDNEMLEKAQAAFDDVGKEIANCHFRDALRHIMALSQEANRYLDSTEPWKTIKENKPQAGTSLWVAVNVIGALSTLVWPFLPFSGDKIRAMLGLSGTVSDSGWMHREVAANQPMNSPKALFTKLEDEVIQQEEERLHAGR